MTGMKLITETANECETKIIVEEKAGGKVPAYFIEGIFMQGNVKNGNGRVYPTKILEKEMARYKKEFIETKRALGELNHPAGPSINADKVSHLITEMWQDGDNFYGKAKILGTPMGKIVQTLIDEGVKIGVSTRGLGSVKSVGGINEVQNDFHLATVDIVTNPSGPDCFVNGIYENAEYYYDQASGNFRAVSELRKIEEAIKGKTRIDEEIALKMFQTFINSLVE